MGKTRSRQRTDINSLPVELIDSIVTQVDELVHADRLHPLHALAGAGNLGGGPLEEGLIALFGGLFNAHGGLQLPRAPQRAPTPPPLPPTPEEIAGELPLHDEVESEDDSDSEDEQPDPEEDDPYDSDGEFDISAGTFPDGLPADPILPLALISRSFLTVARQKLYRKSVLHALPHGVLPLTAPLCQIRYSVHLPSPPSSPLSRGSPSRRQYRPERPSEARTVHQVLSNARDERRTRRSKRSHRHSQTLHRSRGSLRRSHLSPLVKVRPSLALATSPSEF